MAFEDNSGLGVHNHYGPRSTGNTVGVEHSGDSRHQLSVYLNKNSTQETFYSPLVLPKGARITGYMLTVDETFVGVTDITVGEKGAEATNGISLVAADLIEGTRVPSTPAVGEWLDDDAVGDGLTTDQEVGVLVTGVATEGQATLLVTYTYKSRTVGT